jgi:hypothetical protein
MDVRGHLRERCEPGTAPARDPFHKALELDEALAASDHVGCMVSVMLRCS